MAVETTARDPFVAYCETRIAEATPIRCVVEQPDAPPLTNHVGVRHASVLHAGGYEAARGLAQVALGDDAAAARLQLAETQIAYKHVAIGPTVFTAEPAGGDWDSIREKLAAGHSARLAAAVTGTDDNGKTVVSLTVVWSVAPAG